jgi:hypothetical protein
MKDKKERPNPMMENPVGSFVCEGPEIIDNVGGICHVHVVMNHNSQEEMMGTNCTGLSSHLAFFYDPPLGPFSKIVYFNYNVNLYITFCLCFLVCVCHSQMIVGKCCETPITNVYQLVCFNFTRKPRLHTPRPTTVGMYSQPFI